MTNRSQIQGTVDPQFAACRDAFEANFQEGGERGAACAIYRDGQPVLDLWGGSADASDQTPWYRNTAVPVFSVTKGISALCVLSQVSNGRIDLDLPLAHYWPEFAAHGKGNISVRKALAHQAGVPLISGPITIAGLADTAAMAARLAAEAPLFEPGTAHAYHAITVGWITSELMRRVTGQTIGEWFRANLAGPLELNIQIGRSGDAQSPIAAVEVPAEYDTPELDPSSIAARAISLNGLFPARMSGLADAMNDPAVQRVELAGANGVADARSLARLYSKAIGSVGQAPLVSEDCLRDACRTVSSGTPFGQDFAGPTWGAGLMLPWAIQPMLGEGSFGHDGAGGSLAFAHPSSGVSFAYVRNRTGQPGVRDPQVYRVVDALARILGLSIPTY